MAILNGLYIHVTDESLIGDVKTTSHPVESGIPLTDTVRAQAFSISLSGKIVDYGTMTSAQVLAKLKQLRDSGSLIDYRGRNVASNMQIQSLETDFVNTNSGGADFRMELRQVRIAKSAYVPKKTNSAVSGGGGGKKKANTAPSFKVGDKVVFKGGPVYSSSDAKKAAATRGRSTCKLTKISKASYSVHQYHLQSTDGKKVYGWVDAKNVEAVAKTSTDGKTNAGTQQVTKKSSSTKVTHTVKPGDTVWGLVNKNYKNLNTTVDAVMKNNPNAFSRKNDATTLKVGAKLVMTQARV